MRGTSSFTYGCIFVIWCEYKLNGNSIQESRNKRSMPSSIWDHCFLDSDTLSLVEQISSAGSCSNEYQTLSDENAVEAPSSSSAGSQEGHLKICDLQEAINDAELSCRSSLGILDELVTILQDVNLAYMDVTGRTNSLMTNCENLLEQQASS